MAIYVDPPMPIGGKFNNYCHMFADSVDELHQFAERLKLKREWFQDKPDHPHYDIALRKRIVAVKLGAVEVDREFAVRWMQDNRKRLAVERGDESALEAIRKLESYR